MFQQLKLIEAFAQPMERVEKLQKTPLGVKKLANSELLDAFFALIGFFHSFPHKFHSCMKYSG